MHPLRVLLYASVVIAIAVAWGFGAALLHGGTEQTAAVVLAVVAFVAFMLPWTGVFLWAVRRASDLDVLTDRARLAAERPGQATIAQRRYHAELDDLARAVDELRAMVVRQREMHEERKGVVDAIGLGGAPAWLKYLVVAIGVVLLVLALFAWLF